VVAAHGRGVIAIPAARMACSRQSLCGVCSVARRAVRSGQKAVARTHALRVHMLSTYLPALFMLFVATAFTLVIFTLTSVLGTKKMTPEKAIPYESGSESDGANHVRLSVKFYLTAILFVVFDIEAVFLYPWAAIFRQLGWFGLLEMFAFITVLGVTLVYAWKKGALEWEK
jgi:NADH-quinone oxidoreductase subunit A